MHALIVVLVSFFLTACGGVDRALPITAEPRSPPVDDRPLADRPPCPSGVICAGACCPSGFQSRAMCGAMGECALLCFSGGFTDCDGDPTTGCEVQITVDPANCGACGVICPTGKSCDAGRCG